MILGQLQAQRLPQRTVKLLHSLTGPGGDFNIDGRRRWKALLCRRKIGLICKDQMRPFLYQLVEGTFLPGERTGAVEQKQNQIARFDRLLRAKHPDLLDRVPGRADSRGVEQPQQHAVQLDRILHHIAGCAGDFGDN